MPNGATHDRITYWLTPPVAYGGFAWAHAWPESLALGGAFLFAGLMFSGDLDLRSVQYYRWGPARWIWKPYQWLVPHRSPLSHGILLGPAVRLAYLTLALGAIALGTLALWHTYAGGPGVERVMALGLAVPAPNALQRSCGLYALAGLWIGGASHTLADRVGSAWKRLGRGRKRRRRS